MPAHCARFPLAGYLKVAGVDTARCRQIPQTLDAPGNYAPSTFNTEGVNMGNKEFIESLYSAFAKGDIPTVLAGLDDKIE